jgi:hypothetical protein
MNLYFDKTNTFCIRLNEESKIHNTNIDFTGYSLCNIEDVCDIFSTSFTSGTFEKCLMQTHINICKNIVANNIPYALILEDNISFTDNWQDILHNFNDKDFTFIYLSDPHKYNKNGFLSPAYIITKNTAEKIIHPHVICNIDNQTKVLSKIRSNIYSYFPPLIYKTLE